MKKRLVAMGLAVVMMCGGAFLLPSDRSWSSDDFYVIGGGSPWMRNGPNIYYTAGNVGIGTSSPVSPLTVNSSLPCPVYASSSAENATVFQGISTASSGAGWGVYGQSLSTNAANAYGVIGIATGQGSGVYGYTAGGNYGVYGKSGGLGGTGIYGEGPYGVHGKGDVGVYGVTTADIDFAGVYGVSNSRADGIRGWNHSENGIGVCGINLGNGYGVYSFGNFGVEPGFAKNAIVVTSQGRRKLYSQESPEVWFEDFGEGQLMEGLAHVNLDPLFLETVTIDDQHPLKVFVQLNNDCNGVYVQRQATGFEVVELRGGVSSAHFSYRVVAKRKGFENDRLAAAPDSAKMDGAMKALVK
jgi:hypothetical protein